MKIDRLLGILTLLLQRGQMTAPELARKFEVSRRTISRDIDDLCKAGIPLVTTQGYHGGISIAEGYRLDRQLLTAEELQSLLAGLRGVGSVSGKEALDRLAEKLAGSPGRAAEADTLWIDLASHYQGPLTEKIGLLRQAIRTKQLVSFRYYSPKGDSVRTAEPYRLLFQWSDWYLLAYCREREAFRLFKLNRLWELENLRELFPPRELPPEETDPNRYFDRKPYHLKARFEPGEAYRLVEEYGPDSFSIETDGKLLLERDFVSYANMREWVFSFGDKVEILEPEPLRKDRLTQAKNILKNSQET